MAVTADIMTAITLVRVRTEDILIFAILSVYSSSLNRHRIERIIVEQLEIYTYVPLLYQEQL